MMQRKKVITLLIVIFALFLVDIIYPALFSSTIDPFFSRKSQLSIYSNDWNGLSAFRETLEEEDYEVSTIISNPLILNEVDRPADSLYICMGAEKGYDALESDAIIGFVNRGGKVLIADDYGDSNSISRGLGVGFTGHRIWSKDYDYNLSFIKIHAEVPQTWFGNANNQIGSEEYTVLLNEPTTLKLLGTVHKFFLEPEVVFNTSKESYEDTNDNGKIDSFGNLDTYGELPIGSSLESKGREGGIIFFSDSSFCINDMWEREDNANFTLALVEAFIGSDGTVIFDESRHIQSTPIANSVYNMENVYIYVLLQTDQLLGFVIALAFLNLFGLVYALTKHPIRFRHKFDLTYWEAYVEQAPDRLSDVRNILLKRLKANYNLYFPDSSGIHAYEPSTKTKYNLTMKSDLQELIEDVDLVDFLLHPGRYNVADRLNSIVLKIDSEFPLLEGYV